MPWKAVTLDVELDLAEKNDKKPRWKAVRLLFVRGLKEPGEADVSKKDWALFLTTDIQLSMSKMLEIYALRWGIEVYFNLESSVGWGGVCVCGGAGQDTMTRNSYSIPRSCNADMRRHKRAIYPIA